MPTLLSWPGAIDWKVQRPRVESNIAVKWGKKRIKEVIPGNILPSSYTGALSSLHQRGFLWHQIGVDIETHRQTFLWRESGNCKSPL